MENKRFNFDDNLSVIITEKSSNALSTIYEFKFVDRLDKKIGKVHFEFEEFTTINDETLKSIEMAASEFQNNMYKILEEFENILNIDRKKKFDRFLSAVILAFTKMKEKNCTN
ncbi:hypothetical protein [Treponema putidum]|uniref:Uncharacterized protein n=1 Tax=Treponema putidum TaxID=221027 RepID=A0AAE9MUL2_9SPIR|nr:hypothetical protein [Treponema putidum]AIN92767.1 hypothetical protein JO40_00330 [Treponema putidum]TWI75227.1 hypothetical protein JM98_01991 [Treponema putidum]UTY29009.1 hypothetical protein E4N76_08445 [Treponema putidum]UTY31419.1 hypothetical protein E4N75_07840 [Treponema putidum]UTY33860.1 hypothetical protein E4N74_07470 [Treponema putidum]